MRLATWNVNSIRTRFEHLTQFVAKAAPNVLCLQEIKVTAEAFPAEKVRALGYPHVAVRGEKGYNGVAILSDQPFEAETSWSWWGRADARHLSVRLPDAFDLHVFYVPSGGPKPDAEANPKFAHKLGFLDEMTAWSRDDQVAGRKVVILGDFNVAPLETDVWNHKNIKRQVGHTPTECARMATLREAGGYTDVGRHFVPPDQPLYTWWGYRHPRSFQKNYGWRLDHLWVTPALVPHLQAHAVHDYTRGWEKPSDHAPVVVDLR
jgi:exodeoxyribonuclease-3